MIQHAFTQDIRASLTILITDDILDNNRIVDPGDPRHGVPPTYAQWDDTIENVRMNIFRPGDLDKVGLEYDADGDRYGDGYIRVAHVVTENDILEALALGTAYFYVPVGTKTTEGRLIDELFITGWMQGKHIVLVNDYKLMTLGDDLHWTYNSEDSFERQEVLNVHPTWRGYNMVSQWYWLSDEDMFDQPEYVECACWSLGKIDLRTVRS